MLTNELKARIGQLVTDATEKENAGKRADLLARYLGEPYGDEVQGRSQFIDTACQDAVEAILPDIMDVFTSSEDLVEFAPVGPEDEEAAKQETHAVSHIFWQKNPGFLILYTWLKESMIQQNAYVWAGWVEREHTEIDEYEGLTFQEYQAIMQEFEGKEYTIEEQSGLGVLSDEATGAEMVVPELNEDGEESIDIRIRCVETRKDYVIEPFPQEDFFVSPRWHSLDLEGVPCCGRRHRDKTKEDWIAFGFDKEAVRALRNPTDDEESAARFHTKDLDETDDDETVEIYETYVLIDANKDGVPELLKVWCSEDGKHVMKWRGGKEAVEEVSRLPIYALTPYIMPHRHVGQSVVEKTDDIARVKTVLMRQILDNTYATNYARPVFDPDLAGDDALADLMNPRPGAPIRSKSPIEFIAPQPIGNTALPLLQKFDDLQEMRTGATRYNQGLDAESLNKTASGITQIMNASQKKAKLIARTFAETGLRSLFLGIHSDLRRGPIKDMMLRLRGQWTPVNPRTWRHRTDMVVNVGMGKGDRDERRQAFMLAGQVQRELIAAGSRMVDEGKLYQTISDTMGTYGINSVEKYFHDPAKLPPPPPPQDPGPDPIMISAQAQAMKAQADAQRDMARLQADEREKDRKHQERMMEFRLRELELTNRIQNERETLQLKEREAVMKDDLERDKMAVQGTPAVPYGQVTGDTQ